MRLQPDEVMRKGDLYHIRGGEIIPIEYFVGHLPSEILMKGECIERPDPAVDYAAQVKVLRDALQAFVDYHSDGYEEQLAEMAEYQNALAALDATK